MQPSVSLLVYEDGGIQKLSNHKKTGVISSDQLKLPFGNINNVIYEQETGLICMQNIHRQRSFFMHNDGVWSHLSDHQKGKFSFMKIIGKFAIARH